MAKYKKVGFQITAREKEATASLRRLSASFERAMRPIDRLNKKLWANQRAVKRITVRLDRLASKFENFGQKAGLGLSLPITLAGAAAVKSAANFETGMIKVKALTRANQKEFIKLESLAKSLGSTTQFSAREAADGMSFLGMAGFKTNEIIDTIPGVLDLAAAAQLELGESADFASNILTGFGIKKEASEMTKVSDQLTYAFTHSNTNLTELHNGLSKVGGIAIKAGLSFEDMTANMMALADAGHKGETAGVALAGALSRITKFSMDGTANEVSKTLASLGIGVNEFMNTKTGTLKIPFMDFIRLLDKNKAQLADYQKIFGQDAGKYIVGLSGKYEKLADYIDGLKHKSKGLTKSIASEYMSGTEGSFKLLMSALEGLMVALGDTGLLAVVNASMRSLAHLVQDMSTASKLVLRLAIAAGVVVVVLPSVASLLGVVAKTISIMLPFTSALTGGFVLIGLKVMAVTALVSGLIYAGFLLVKNWDWVVFKVNKAFAWLKANLILAGKVIAATALSPILAVVSAIALVKDAFVELLSFAAGKLNIDLDLSGTQSWTQTIIDQLGRFFKSTENLSPAEKFKRNSPLEKQIVTDDFLATLKPRSILERPLVYEGFMPREYDPKFKALPDFISKGFAGVFDSAEPLPVAVVPEEGDNYYPDKKQFDFNSLKQVVSQTTITEKQQLDVNIKLEGANEKTKVEAKNRSRSRVSVDTGPIMVGL